MTDIILQGRAANSTNLLIITDKFNGLPGLPENIRSYIHTQLYPKRESGRDAKKSLHYNHEGAVVSVIVVDKSGDPGTQSEQLRKHGASLADALNANGATEVCIYNQCKQALLALHAAEGIVLGNYQFLRHKPSAKETNKLNRVVIADARVKAGDIKALKAVCEATLLARDLVNEPVNHLNAAALGEAFKKMGNTARFKVTVYNKAQIVSLKMGGLLAVNAGSVDEPTFTVMEYKPKNAKNKKPVVLVGKGVVYDTGGLSLKPTPNSMDLMKCDMAGGAAVGGALYAIARAQLNVHVIGLVPATDNRPGFNAFAPGDIITMMDGSTVEMLNSDAEGRMILADALHFAKRYEPLLTIDLATLTGSAIAAIGTFGMVGMGNLDGKKRDKLHESGRRVHERIAEFPFWDEYGELLKSDIADQKNIGGPLAGAITAGKFLQKFTNYPYYHLDIAGPAFLSTRDSYRGKGGTGCGVRLLFDFLKNL